MQTITPFLWFNTQAQEAANYYVDVFSKRNKGECKILSSSPVVTEFLLEGLKVSTLNGGPEFTFSEAVSFLVDCENQDEVDYLWDKLTVDGGAESQCGWLKDKWGFSWQIVPKQLMELMSNGTPEQTNRVMKKMLTMKKIMVKDLEQAFHG